MSYALPPGFMVVHGNHPESLRDLMLAWMVRHPLAPLEDEQILVQSNGVAQWLKISLAGDRAHGGVGIAAALQVQLPSRFMWQAYRAVLGAREVPPASPFDKGLLTWRLMQLLPTLLTEEVFAPLARFLDKDASLRKRHQLAERLADLFDQYQVYRADWLADWARGDDVIATSRQGVQAIATSLRWQPRLWRALLASVSEEEAASTRAEVHRRFRTAVAAHGDERPAGLPPRVIVFGVSSLPQQSLEVLGALARWCQVLMCVHNPCEHDWSHIVPDKDLLRAERLRRERRPGSQGAIADESLHLHAQPLLAAWGKQGRDFIRLLDTLDDRDRYEGRFIEIGQRIDWFVPNAGASLLQQVQDDIRDLRPLAETRARWPAVDPGRDSSIRFHVAHGPQREVEILHDQLLAALAADPGLHPRDIVVMVPDIATYAPHIQAVFGLPDFDDVRRIPFIIADQGQRHQDPLLGAVERLLGLPESRIGVTDALDLLEVPALRARFGIAEDQLPLLHRWIGAAGIRWGLHAEQRESMDLPPGLTQNTWVAGLRRMLLGYAVGTGAAWGDIVPMDEIGGLDAALLGPLVRFLEALQSHWTVLRDPATPDVWVARMRTLLADFLAPEEGGDDLTLARLLQALQAWQDACTSAGFDEPLPLSVLREHWLAQMDQGTLTSAFFAGAVTFATLMPMRAIPFRRVALLGMNGGDYPRSRPPMDFDLMAQDYRPGDRSRREDDRYLFLEALLSAREHLHVSWVGRSIVDNSERPPSVLVAQLRDHLAAGWQLAGHGGTRDEAGQALIESLTVEHRLQPFNPEYFTAAGPTGLFSYALEWRPDTPASAASDAAVRSLPPLARMPTLTVRGLAEFLKDPVRYFFQRRLAIHFDELAEAEADHEPFEVGKLDNWRLQAELIKVQRAAYDADPTARAAALAAGLDVMKLRGDLPVGAFGVAAQHALAEPMEELFADYARALGDWPVRLANEPVSHVTSLGSFDVRVDDWLDDLRENAGGFRGRIVVESTGLVKKSHYRMDKLLPYWVVHLAGHLAGRPLTTLLLSKAGSVTLPPLDPAQARAHWDTLVQAWLEAHSRALPLAVETGFAWLLKGGAADGAPDEAAKAARTRFEGGDFDDGSGGGERDRNVYVARIFPDFAALSHDGEFARLADALLRPLRDAVGKPPKAAAKASSAASSSEAA